MRTYFRAIELETGRLIIGHIIQMKGNTFCIKENPDETITMVPVFNEPIMRPIRPREFTGEMLFEHDVLNYSGGELVIGWNYTRHRFIMITKGGEVYSELQNIHRNDLLGNIYETERFKTAFRYLFVSG